ncbi:hypothetical protein FRC02_007175 [Tulasnella sp. 418]|nr:hypothetical protein FRC02_007175 [Tulasnella sp. 418]
MAVYHHLAATPSTNHHPLLHVYYLSSTMSPSAKNGGNPLIGEFTSGVGLDCGLDKNTQPARITILSPEYPLPPPQSLRIYLQYTSSHIIARIRLVFAFILLHPSTSCLLRPLHTEDEQDCSSLHVQRQGAESQVSDFISAPSSYLTSPLELSSSQGIPSSSNQTQSSSTHPNVEQIWAAFAPSSTPQVIWPVRANHTSSTRSNRKISNFPTTVLGLNNQTAKAESSSTCSDKS